MLCIVVAAPLTGALQPALEAALPRLRARLHTRWLASCPPPAALLAGRPVEHNISERQTGNSAHPGSQRCNIYHLACAHARVAMASSDCAAAARSAPGGTASSPSASRYTHVHHSSVSGALLGARPLVSDRIRVCIVECRGRQRQRRYSPYHAPIRCIASIVSCAFSSSCKARATGATSPSASPAATSLGLCTWWDASTPTHEWRWICMKHVKSHECC